MIYYERGYNPIEICFKGWKVKMKYRIRFNGWIEVNRDNAEEAYDAAESKLRNVLRPLEHNDGVSEIDIYDFEAEECD